MSQDNINIVVFITAASREEAEKIASNLLLKKQVACINILPEAQSRYWWKGKIESAAEYVLLAKSNLDHLDQIIQTVKSIHSYEVPEIIALPVIGGNADYLDWMLNTVEGG
jgi:periplasmic divalent cation tolerance protein